MCNQQDTNHSSYSEWSLFETQLSNLQLYVVLTGASKQWADVAALSMGHLGNLVITRAVTQIEPALVNILFE